MNHEYIAESLVGTIEVRQGERGSEYIQLNAYCAAYFRSRDTFSKCTLVTQSSKHLPMVGYLIPTMYDEKYVNQPSRPADPQTYVNSFIPALQIALTGGTAGTDYSLGSTVSYSVGLLHFSAISHWDTWLDIREPWTLSIWEKAGFDFRLFIRRYWYLRNISTGKDKLLTFSLETITIEEPIDFEMLQAAPLQTLSDLLQVDAQGGPSLNRALRHRVHSLTALQIQETLAMGKRKVFSEIKNVTAQLSKRLKRLLIVSALFKYWDENPVKFVSKAETLAQLGLLEKRNESTVWNDCVEAGCIAPSRSMLIKKLQGIRNQARFYFDRHPQDLVRLEDEIEQERVLYRDRIKEDQQSDPLVRWGMKFALPSGK